MHDNVFSSNNTGKVYDVTKFVDQHPGGDLIVDGAGKVATDLFEDVGHRYYSIRQMSQQKKINFHRIKKKNSQHAKEILNEYYIGEFQG